MPLKKGAYTGDPYNQDQVNAWWTESGQQGPPPTVPQEYIGARRGSGRDIHRYGADGKRLKNSKSGRAYDNYFNRVAYDQYREQSGASKIAGGALSLVSLIPGVDLAWAAMNAANKYGNEALAKDGAPKGVEFQTLSGTSNSGTPYGGPAPIGEIPTYSPIASSSTGSTMADKKQPSGSTQTSRDNWFTDAARGALGRAGALADRPYTPYEGERVAGLSGNEQQAYDVAGGMGERYAPMVGRLQGGFSPDALSPFMNPYTDKVLDSRLRTIGDEFGRQSASLDRNAAATDAFRTGRTDLQRARLNASRLRAVDEATNETQAAAFESGKDAYFRQNAQDMGAIGAITSADASQAETLSRTGGAERSVRQAEQDFDYGQFLERRDWTMNNLNSLLAAIGAVNPAAGSLSKSKEKKGDSGTDWAAVGGVLLTAAGEYYGWGG